MRPHSDQWAAGATYEQFMGRWSRQLARELVDWLHPTTGLHWLDLGCGTGSLTSAICERGNPASVTACDPAAPFIEYAAQHVRDPRARFVTASATDFPLRDGGYDAIASLLALNFIPDPKAALNRMQLAAAPGGTIAASVWDYAEGMQFLRYFWDAAIEVEPLAREMDEGTRFPICNPEALTAFFQEAGLSDVRCDPIEIVTGFANFDDYWAPMLGGTGPAPALVNSLSAEKQEELRSRLETTLPLTSAGEIDLRARAWAVRGTTPRGKK
jgi:trans-aconitate methyltransferase